MPNPVSSKTSYNISKRKTKTTKVNNRFIVMSSYKLKTQHVKVTNNVLVDCLSRLVDAKLINHNNEPKGQEFECTMFEKLPPYSVQMNYRSIFHRQTFRHPKAKTFTEEGCILQMHMQISHILSVQKQFVLDDETLYRLMLDRDKYLEALIVSISLASTILLNSQNLQEHTGTTIIYSTIRGDIFFKDMHKDVDIFTQNCNFYSKESPFFLLFGRDPLTPLRKLLSPKMRYQGYQRVLFDLEGAHISLH